MDLRSALAMLAGGVFVAGSESVGASGQDSDRDRANWVQQVLIRMQTVKVGMTRIELLKLFTTEGGVWTPLQRTYVSRDCPYFKVDVRFRAFGQPGTDSEGRMIAIEDARDQIVQMSRFYVAFGVMD